MAKQLFSSLKYKRKTNTYMYIYAYILIIMICVPYSLVKEMFATSPSYLDTYTCDISIHIWIGFLFTNIIFLCNLSRVFGWSKSLYSHAFMFNIYLYTSSPICLSKSKYIMCIETLVR